VTARPAIGFTVDPALDAGNANGFVRDVSQHLPMEFLAETRKLIGISLEGSVG
jgi:hypothetical protein